jgi:hypothetical protein
MASSGFIEAVLPQAGCKSNVTSMSAVTCSTPGSSFNSGPRWPPPFADLARTFQ